MRLLMIALLLSGIHCGADEEPAAPGVAKLFCQIDFPPEATNGLAYPLAVSPRGNRVAVMVRTVAPEVEVADRFYLFTVTDGKAVPLADPVPPGEFPEAVMFDDAGRRMLIRTATRRMERTLRVVDVETGDEVFREQMKDHALLPLMLTPDGECVLRPVPVEDGPPQRFELIRCADGTVVTAFLLDEQQAAHGAVGNFELSADRQMAVAVQGDWILGWSRPGQLTLRWQWDGDGSIRDVGLIGDGRQARAVMEEGTVVTFDLEVGHESRRLRLELPPQDPKQPEMQPLGEEWALHDAVIVDDGELVLRADYGRIACWRTSDGSRLGDITLRDPSARAYVRLLRGEYVPAIRPGTAGPVALLRLEFDQCPMSRPAAGHH